MSGFDTISQPEGRWPKLRHRETGTGVEILPEGGRPGTASRPAPTTIPHPKTMGAVRGRLKYITFLSLIELKLAAGGLRDEASKGKWKGYRSSRLGDQWRVIYHVDTEKRLFQVASITAHDYRKS